MNEGKFIQILAFEKVRSSRSATIFSNTHAGHLGTKLSRKWLLRFFLPSRLSATIGDF